MGLRVDKNPNWGKTASLILDAIKVMSGVKMRVVWIADLLGVNSRTVYRVLEILKDKGMPLRSEKNGVEVYYWLDKEEIASWFTPPRMKTKLKQAIIRHSRKVVVKERVKRGLVEEEDLSLLAL